MGRRNMSPPAPLALLALSLVPLAAAAAADAPPAAAPLDATAEVAPSPPPAPTPTPPSPPPAEAADTADAFDALPRARRAGGGLDHLGRHAPGALWIDGEPAPRLRGGRSRDTRILVDGFRIDADLVPWPLVDAVTVAPTGHGAARADAPGGLVELRSAAARGAPVAGAVEAGFERRARETPAATGTLDRFTILPRVDAALVPGRLALSVAALVETERGAYDHPSDPAPERPIEYDAYGAGLKLEGRPAAGHRLTLLGALRAADAPAPPRTDDDPADRDRRTRAAFAALRWDARPHPALDLRLGLAVRRDRAQERPTWCAAWPQACDPETQLRQTLPVTIGSNGPLALEDARDGAEALAGATIRGELGPVRHEAALTLRAELATNEEARRYARESITLNGAFFSSRLERLANAAGAPLPGGWWRGDARTFVTVTGFEDRATIGRLAVSPGVALVTSRASASAATLSDWALLPGLGLTVDVTGDGRTTLTAGAHRRVDADLGAAAAFARGGPVERDCRYDARADAFSDCRVRGGPASRAFGARPRMPRTFDLAAAAERALGGGLRVGVEALERRFERLPERTSRAAPPAEAGPGSPAPIALLASPRAARRRYRGVTPFLRGAVGPHLHVRLAYTWSELEETIAQTPFLSPSMAPTSVRLVAPGAEDRRHVVQGAALVRLRHASFGLVYGYWSGRPAARRLRAPAGADAYADYRAPVGVDPGVDLNDPSDDRPLRIADLQTVDLQVRIRAALGDLRVEPFVDVLNLLAARAATAVVEVDGPRFGQPTRRQEGRVVRFGLAARY
jgi:hypothetical protein